ncbi:MAG: hypothetical protein Q8930_16325, partial [Bacillota bacterium]|nr:hypothetical protein [Bacillota bacterium]
MANKVKRKTAVFTIFLLLCSDILWSAPVKISASIAAADNIDNVITMAAVIKFKELNLINLKSNIIVRLDDGGMFSRPLISVGKTHIAYLKDTALYISDTEGRRRMVHNNICMECYTWLDNNSLIYSPDTGGLYIYDVLKNKSFPYIEDKFNYRNITIGKYKNIYAEKYFNYIKNGSQYRKDYGIIMINSNTKAEKLLIKSIPIEIGEGLGMYPVIAGISKDLRFLFVFAFPHSASMAS